MYGKIDNDKLFRRCGMGFLAGLIETLIKMVFIAVVAYGGIRFGRYLRMKKDAKDTGTPKEEK